MKIKAALLTLSTLTLSCNAFSIEEQNTGTNGTYAVIFTPLKSGGKLTACTLNFTAGFEDRTHLNSKQYVLNGHVGVYSQNNNNLAFIQKTGFADVSIAPLKIEKPYSAYVETKNKSTASLDKKTFTGDNNFLFSVASLDETALDLIEEMHESKSLRVGFNRTKGGIDFLVPIDLRVSGSTMQQDGSYRHTFSDSTTVDYIECITRLVSETIGVQK
jgi:hypothetical protein